LVVIIFGGISEVGLSRISRSINLDEIAKNFQNETVYNFPKSDSSLFLGSVGAPVQLTVFSSFQCPACKAFAHSLENVHKKFGKNIGITFKNFPLSSACNPKMKYDMQPRSCEAAYAAIAADRQNRFWNYHDQLFQSNLAADEKTLSSIARNMGLNMEKWEYDRHSDEVKARLSEDIKKAYEIGINATPSVFINGRKVTNIQEPILNFIIQNELEKVSK
jgi:protein-disulfide isomerase